MKHNGLVDVRAIANLLRGSCPLRRRIVLVLLRGARVDAWAGDCVMPPACFAKAVSSVCGLCHVLLRNTWADECAISPARFVNAARLCMWIVPRPIAQHMD